ncbi:hypothetical protein [Rickettsia endosymbiont of Cardiosporidium cionae]|nr:hypothetical protein [Rickettsia endosymbiont of Cardiosporidium cionae]
MKKYTKHDELVKKMFKDAGYRKSFLQRYGNKEILAKLDIEKFQEIDK